MNSKIKKYEIDSFPKLINVLEKISAKEKVIWFRGLESVSHKLTPSIFRTPFKPSLEDSFVRAFKSRALPYLKTRPTDNYWEWLFIMQHHGLPTRLLDWSKSALTALGFALIFRNSTLYKGHDAALWCLNPEKLNPHTAVSLTSEDAIPDIVANEDVHAAFRFKPSLKSEYPIAINGPINSERIANQKGTFTLFPNCSVFNLEDKDKAHEFLTFIKIKKSCITTLTKQLYYLGVTESTIYPDLPNLSTEIKREYIESTT